MATRTQERGLNWTLEERNFLIDLIESKKDIIENKQSDFASVHERKQAWLEMAKQYTAAYPPGREAQKIKEQYQRLKSNAKKEMVDYHSKAGTRLPGATPSELSLRISMLAPSDFKRNSCCWDSEAHGKWSTEHNDHDNSATLVNLKTEVDGDDGNDSAQTCHFVGNSSYGKHHPDVTEQSNSRAGNSSTWHQDVTCSPPRGLEKAPGQKTKLRKRSLSMVSSESLQADVDHVWSTNRKLWGLPQESLYNFHKTEHELRMKQLEAEHKLRMEILVLKKKLLERKIHAINLKVSK